MAEGMANFNSQLQTREAILALATSRIGIIEQAALEIGGPAAEVTDVFPAPMAEGQARTDAEVPDWDESQAAAARKATHELGYGSVENVQSGLNGALALVEAGLAWKYDFEETLIDGENPSALAYAGSPWVFANAKELAHVKKQHNVELKPGTSQYDIARMLAGRLVVEHAEEIVPIGYAVAEGNPTIYAPTGQIQLHGKTAQEQPIYTIRTDREQLADGKYRHQPDSAALFGLVSDMLKGQVDISTPIALLTTQLYASRVIDSIRAGLLHDRQFGVAMSGRATRAAILEEPLQDDLPLEQVPGELHVAYKKYKQLADVAASQLEKLQG